MGNGDVRSEDRSGAVRENLFRRLGTRGAAVSGTVVRSSARAALNSGLLVGGSAAQLGREAVSGAAQAIEEVGGEARAMVRDAMIGVIEGTNQVVVVTTPVVKDMVAGAFRNSNGATSDAAEISRGAVEGAIVGAVAVGIDAGEAAASATAGAVAAMADAATNTEEVVGATMGGVVSGVSAAEGDVPTAAEAAAYALMAHGAAGDRSSAELASMAERAMDAVIVEVEANHELDVAVVAATATGTVAAAY